MVIKGCIGFSRIGNSLITKMLLVRGKRVVEVPLIWPISTLMIRLWKTKNILGKILFKKSNFKQEMERAKLAR